MSQLAVFSSRAPEALSDALKKYGKEVLTLPPHPALPEPVSCHADMIMTYFDDTVYFDKIYSETYPDIIKEIEAVTGASVAVTEERIGEKYPGDCLLNVAVGKRAAFGHARCSRTVRRAVAASGREFIAVKQGYAACSTLIAGGALITADGTIADAAADHYDVLAISPGHIELEPYDAGFIGGACGADGKCVYFAGDVDHHPDAAAIKDHLASNFYKTVPLMHGALVDVGGIKFINIV